MDPKHLEAMILRHKNEGRRPFFVNCTSGTTVMGAFDPINDIADICQEHNIWMHIDVSMYWHNVKVLTCPIPLKIVRDKSSYLQSFQLVVRIVTCICTYTANVLMVDSTG